MTTKLFKKSLVRIDLELKTGTSNTRDAELYHHTTAAIHGRQSRHTPVSETWLDKECPPTHVAIRAGLSPPHGDRRVQKKRPAPTVWSCLTPAPPRHPHVLSAPLRHYKAVQSTCGAARPAVVGAGNHFRVIVQSCLLCSYSRALRFGTVVPVLLLPVLFLQSCPKVGHSRTHVTYTCIVPTVVS